MPSREKGWHQQTLRTEISRTQQVISVATGSKPCAFRPPGGIVKGGRKTVRQAGLSVALWSVDTRDWSGLDARAIRSRARLGLHQHHPIILLHDGGAHRQALLAALPGIIADYRAAGYKFVTIAGAA